MATTLTLPDNYMAQVVAAVEAQKRAEAEAQAQKKAESTNAPQPPAPAPEGKKESVPTTPERAEEHLETPKQPAACDGFAEYTEEEIREMSQAASEPLPLVPNDLKAKPNWVLWKLELVNGRMTKVPYQLNGSKASSTNPSTWNTYEAIVNNVVINETQGVGIMCDGSFVGFDLDGCRNPVTGEITGWAKKIVATLGSYTEITPSGYGVRVYTSGKKPNGPNRFSVNVSAGYGDKVGIEVYSETRYFTVTGNEVQLTTHRPNLHSHMYPGVPDDDIIVAAYQLCADISREFPSEKRKQASQFGGSDSGSTVVYTKKPNSILTSKLAVLMYGKITSRKPFVIEDDGGSVETHSQSEADMSLATLLAMKHGDKPELIDQDFRESALCREKWEGRNDYRNNTIGKAIETAKKFAEKTAAQASSAQVNPASEGSQGTNATPGHAQATADAASEASQGAEGTFPFGDEEPKLPESAFTSTRLGDLYNEVFKPNDWPVELALPALATAGSVLVPIEPPQVNSGGSGFILRNNPIVNLYTALISEVHAGKTQVIEWSAKALGIYREVRGPNYVGVQFGSAEQMWKFLNKHSFLNDQTTSAFRNAVLINPDEWAHVMAKAGIPDSSFAYALTTAFYKRNHTITLGGQGGGRDVLIPFPFSMAGGIVKDEFDSVFGATTVGGLYDRFLFGLAPENFMWSYREFPITHPLFQGKGRLEFTPTSVQVDPSLYEVINHWNKKDRSLGRIVEMCSRVATIFASMDGRSIVTGADLEKLEPLAKYQQAIRAVYRPNPGMNPDAVYSNSVLNWVGKHAQQWRTIRELQKGTNYQRRKLGPYVCQRTLKTLATDNQVELWTSTVRADGWLNPLPPDYQGPRPKIGSGLVRIGAR